MAFKYTGTSTFVYGLNVHAAKPLDSRTIVESTADLTNFKSTFQGGGVPMWYVGMQVFNLEDKKLYVLVDETTGFKPVGADESALVGLFDYKGSKSTFGDLPKSGMAKGDVWNVEEEFSIVKIIEGDDPTGTGDDVTISKKYPAGTNVVWTGTEWDPLGGSIDLSGYVTNDSYTSLSNTVAAQGLLITANEANIAANTAAISNKVEKNGTDRLITEAEGAAIAKVAGLEAKDTNLESRLSVVEGFFTDSEGGELNLSGIQQQISANSTQIQSLSTNKADKSTVETLEGKVTTAEGNIAGLIAEDVKINSRCDGLVTRIEALEATDLTVSNTLSGYNERINANNTAIQALQSAGYLTASDITGKADTVAVEAAISTNLANAKKYADDLKTAIDTAYAAADVLTLEAAKKYADEAAANVDFDDSALQTAIQANAAAIEVLNGSGDGSVSKQISNAITAFAGSINDNETIENLTELLAFANDHKDIADTVALAAANSTTLQTLTGTGTGSISKTVEDAVAVEKTRAEAVESGLSGRIKTIEDDYLKSSNLTAFQQLVSEETNRAQQAETGLSTRIKTIEDDYLKNVDKQALEALISKRVESSVYEAKITELENSIKASAAALEWIPVGPAEPEATPEA